MNISHRRASGQMRIAEALRDHLPELHNSGYTPLAGDTLERLGSAVVETEVGADHEVLDRVRHEHLARSRERAHSCADVYADAGNIGASPFDLAGVQPGADVDAEWPYGLTHRQAAADPTAGPVECREEPVACALDDDATLRLDCVGGGRVVLLEEVAPALDPRAGRRAWSSRRCR